MVGLLDKKSGNILDQALVAFSESRELLSGGGAAIKSPQDYATWLNVIVGSIHERTVSPNELRRICEGAANVQQIIDRPGFISHVKRGVAAHLSNKREEYCVIFPLVGVHELFPSKKIRENEVEISFVSSKAALKRSKLIGDRKNLSMTRADLFSFSAKYAEWPFANVKLYARCPDDAIYFAELELRRRLGIISFAAEYRMRPSGVFGHSGNLPPLVIAPFITIHRKVDDVFEMVGLPATVAWSEFIKTTSVNDPGLATCKKNISLILRKLKNSKVKIFLDDFFVAYHEVFSEPDAATAFLRAWSVFERLTGADEVDASHAVKRAAILFDDYELATAEGEYLRGKRNRFTHSARVPASEHRIDAEGVRFLMEPLVVRLLDNSMGIQKVSEFWRVLDFVIQGEAETDKKVHIAKIAKKFFAN